MFLCCRRVPRPLPDTLEPDVPPPPPEKPLRVWPLAILGILLLLGFHLLVFYRQELDPLAIGYDTVQFSPGQFYWTTAYLFLGGGAALSLALACHPLFTRSVAVRRALGWGRASNDRAVVLTASLLAFLTAAAWHHLALQEIPLVDDEGVYRFAAQILAQGRFYLPGDPDPDFFTHPFVVQGDRIFTQYFLGWPALMLPFLLLGIEVYANAFYFALSMPPLFLILRQLCGPGWARFGLVLALSSPILSISAATLLSHSSCILALCWFTLFALRCRETEAPWAWHAGMALAFSAAFFIRPLSAIGVGLPWLLCWVWDLKRQPRPFRTLLAFVLPAFCSALLFFGINRAINGHPLQTAYGSFLEHASSQAHTKDLMPHRELAFESPVQSLSIAAAATQRLNFAAFGWPISWLFVFFAGRERVPKILLVSVGTFYAANFSTTVVGVDGYGPMHYLELALPLLLLTVLGLKRATERSPPGAQSLPLGLALASMLVALTSYFPYQARTLWEMTEHERLTRKMPADLGTPAVIFAEMPWEVKSCRYEDLKPWVQAPPMYDPDLRSEVLWLVSVDPEKDREFARRRFPDRAAYRVQWQPGCRRAFLPIEP